MAPHGLRKLTPRKCQLLLAALLESYPEELPCGYLMEVRVCGDCAAGFAYRASGFDAGEAVATDVIVEVCRYPGRWLLKTRSCGCWVVVNFAPGGRQSLLHLIELFESARLAQSKWCLH